MYVSNFSGHFICQYSRKLNQFIAIKHQQAKDLRTASSWALLTMVIMRQLLSSHPGKHSTGLSFIIRCSGSHHNIQKAESSLNVPCRCLYWNLQFLYVHKFHITWKYLGYGLYATTVACITKHDNLLDLRYSSLNGLTFSPDYFTLNPTICPANEESLLCDTGPCCV